MNYKAYGYSEEDDTWIKDRKTRKDQRKETFIFNKALHSQRAKQERRESK